MNVVMEGASLTDKGKLFNVDESATVNALLPSWRQFYFTEQRGRRMVQSVAANLRWVVCGTYWTTELGQTWRVVPCRQWGTIWMLYVSHRQPVKIVSQGRCDVIILSHAHDDACLYLTLSHQMLTPFWGYRIEFSVSTWIIYDQLCFDHITPTLRDLLQCGLTNLTLTLWTLYAT